MVDIIIAVKPEYAKKILDGLKLFEFRKQKPRRLVSRVYIYASAPNKKIVGCFRMGGVISGSPEEIWKKCGRQGGIEKDKFFSYFGDCKIGYGLEVGDVQRFDPPIDPFEVNCDFKAPQSFAYVHDIGKIGLTESGGASLQCQISDRIEQ